MSYVNYMRTFMCHLKVNNFFKIYKDEFEISKIQKLNKFYNISFYS